MNFLILWLQESGGIWFYFIVFVSSLAENLFTPLPGDAVTVFAAYLAGRGEFSLIGVYISSTLGGTAGFMGLFGIGGLLYKRAEKREKIFGIPFSTIDTISVKFKKWGYLIILLNRFLYGIRFAVALFAGLMKLPWIKVLIYALIGTIAWNTVLVYAGGALGDNWVGFKYYIWKYNRYLLGLLLGLLTAGFVWLYLHGQNGRNKMTDSQSD